MNRPLRFLRGALCVTVLAACGRADDPEPTVAAQQEPAGAGATAVGSEPPTVSADSASPAPADPVPAGTETAPVPPVVDTQAFSAPAGSQDPAVRLLDGAAARYSAIRSMSADFDMETRNPLLRESIRSRGRLFQRRPDRILLRFEEPAGDILVSDGRYFWVWYPSVDSTQVVRSPASAGAGGVDLLAQFVGSPTERFRWTVRGTESLNGRMATILALDPRGEEAYQQLVVWIDHEDFLVHRFEVTEHSGVVRRIDLRGITLDPDLADSLFRFEAPPGVRIIGAP